MTMKRWTKVLLIGGALVVALVAGLLVTAYLLFDAEKIKTALVESVADKTGRRLAIEGLPELHFWPQLSIRLGKVSLSEKLSDEVFAGVDHVSVAIGVLPLLSGELRADTVEVSGLRARVVRYASGSFNFSDLLAGEPPASAAEQPPAAAPAAGSPLRFAIAGIRIGGHELAWQDDLAKRRIALSDFTLDTGELGIDAGGELSFAGTVSIADGATAAPAESLRASLRSAYRLAAESIVLSGLRGEFDGALAGISGLKLAVGGERIALATATGVVDASGVVVDLGGKLAAMTLQAKLTLPQLGWQETAPASGTQRLSLPGATLAATIEQPPRRIEASLRSAVTLSLPAMDLALADMAGEVLASDPQLLRQPVKLVLAGAATANLERLGAAFKGTLSVDDSKAVLDLALDSPQPLSARASVDLDQLDLDRYLLPPAPPQPAAAGAPAQPAGDVPVDLSPLAGKTIKARIGVGRLKVREIVAEQIRVEAALANGKLELTPLSAKVYAGQVEARLTANAADRALALRARLSGVSLQPLLRDVAKIEFLSGRANVDTDLKSSGATVAALKAALAGELRLRVADGAVKGINLAQRFRELKGRGAPADASAGDAQEATDFTELTGSFRIRDGVVRGDDLAAKSPFLRLAGAGEVDLPQETLDYLLKASVVNTSAGQGGEGLEHLSGLTVPVRLSGPLAQPKWKIEIGSLLDDAAKARVAAKKAEIKDEIKARTQEGIGDKREALRDKAKDKLKGLLGR